MNNGIIYIGGKIYQSTNRVPYRDLRLTLGGLIGWCFKFELNHNFKIKWLEAMNNTEKVLIELGLIVQTKNENHPTFRLTEKGDANHFHFPHAMEGFLTLTKVENPEDLDILLGAEYAIISDGSLHAFNICEKIIINGSVYDFDRIAQLITFVKRCEPKNSPISSEWVKIKLPWAFLGKEQKKDFINNIIS